LGEKAIMQGGLYFYRSRAESSFFMDFLVCSCFSDRAIQQDRIWQDSLK
jgi:hypothetical protein